MSWLHRARLQAQQRLGVDVARYPQSHPLHRTVRLLSAASVTVVLDVGANDGGYGRALRRLGYRQRIVSFEPTSAAFSRLERATAGDPRWEAHHLALGDRDGRLDINVAGNDAASSSFLPMLEQHVEANPGSAYVATEEVEIRRLDAMWSELLGLAGERVFLKLDVQGAEGMVLDGAAGVLGDLVGVQTEMNLAPLYEGQIDYRDVLDRMDDAGFSLVGIIPGFVEPRTGRTLEVDGVFMREDALVGPATP